MMGDGLEGSGSSIFSEDIFPGFIEDTLSFFRCEESTEQLLAVFPCGTMGKHNGLHQTYKTLGVL